MELYIHLPFCKSKCRYCDFASFSGCERYMPQYVNALLQEAETRAAEWKHPVMDSVFIGGGTPSLLPADLFDSMLKGIRELFPFAADAEITSEANPGTLTKAWLDVALQHGVNRLSLGMQAKQPSILNMLGRIHTHEQVEHSVALARSAGLSNISLDLMFGLPGQTVDDWRETLQAALALKPQHLSCYGLIPEDGTPLKAQLDKGVLSLPDEETERRMYDDAIDLLSRNGFVQYEISNFSLPGYECRHNIGYWRQIPYIGLGAAASSMLPSFKGEDAYLRSTNPATLDDYFHMVDQRLWDLRDIVSISPAEARFETLMLGLRTTQGVSATDFAQIHGVSLHALYGRKLEQLERCGLLQHDDDWWRLTRRGMDVQNAILVELLDE